MVRFCTGLIVYCCYLGLLVGKLFAEDHEFGFQPLVLGSPVAITSSQFPACFSKSSSAQPFAHAEAEACSIYDAGAGIVSCLSSQLSQL